VQAKLKAFELNLDISTSKSIFNILSELIKSSEVEVCLTHLISKPMARVSIFQRNLFFKFKTSTPDEFWHYALSIPIYTHFTCRIEDILIF